jgi:hypothetical protein
VRLCVGYEGTIQRIEYLSRSSRRDAVAAFGINGAVFAAERVRRALSGAGGIPAVRMLDSGRTPLEHGEARLALGPLGRPARLDDHGVI